MAVVVETTIGDFTVDLYTDQRSQTCRNFLKLCKVKYYNWNLFHTVQSNFIAQTGDPTGTGKGGESIYGTLLGEKARYYEAEQMPKMKHDRVGLLSMVNCGDNMLGSQFFITLDRDLQSLDGEHCVFGEITEGLEIILKFNEAICDGDHRPYQDIRISHTVVLEDPYEDPETLVVPVGSPEPTQEALMSDRIGADEAIDDTVGMSMEEIAEARKEKEAKARATILEIVGDIPDADMAPPENVLFVCKLNPVTNDDDLEIIFSRFGKIVGCEVIRDRQTGDSLQYAFIEFADRKSCEEAYFKMDNVLIDDRRIHVDFSQSVSKMRWRGKGKGIMYKDEKRSDGRKRQEENDDRGGGKRRRNSSDQREGRYDSSNNEKSYDDRQRSQKYDRRKENEKYRRNGEERYDKRKDDEERYDKRRDGEERDDKRKDDEERYNKRRDGEERYERRRDDEERYEKRRDDEERYEKRRDDGDKDRYSEKRKGNDRGKESKHRSDVRMRRESRSRSHEHRSSQSADHRQKKRDEKRRDCESRPEKSNRLSYGDKRSRDQSEESYRKNESRHNHRNK